MCLALINLGYKLADSVFFCRDVAVTVATIVACRNRSGSMTNSYTLCLKKKGPPVYSLQLCQILTDFQNFCTTGKRIKFAT